MTIRTEARDKLLAAGLIPLLAVSAQSLAQRAEPDDPNWQHPTTSRGDPDLQGIWPVHRMTLTPLERPSNFGTRAQQGR